MNATKVILDTDPGVDDAMAILFASQHAGIELVGLTSVFGNVTTDVATRNALVLAELTGQHIPVARGADVPLVQTPQPVADFVHGKQGFGSMPAQTPTAQPIDQSAARFICDMADQHAGELVLCPVGPLTNIAQALTLDPSITSKVEHVVVMGGSIKAGGNATPYAEANMWQDPHAAAQVFQADWNVKMVGLDVTHQVLCIPPEFDELAEKAPVIGGFLNEASQFYFRFHEKHDGIFGCHMHDPSAVIAILHPELFQTQALSLDVVKDGERVGETIADPNVSGNGVECAMQVDSESVKRIFLDTIAASF